MIELQGKYVTAKEASVIVRRTVNAVNKMAIKHGLGVKVGNIRLFTEEDIAFLKELRPGRKEKE